jgi:hypothetical protein
MCRLSVGLCPVRSSGFALYCHLPSWLRIFPASIVTGSFPSFSRTMARASRSDPYLPDWLSVVLVALSLGYCPDPVVDSACPSPASPAATLPAPLVTTPAATTTAGTPTRAPEPEAMSRNRRRAAAVNSSGNQNVQSATASTGARRPAASAMTSRSASRNPATSASEVAA